jgi:hypothetical protein
MILVGLPLFNCPSRRGSDRYPSNRHPGMHGYGSIAPADGRLPKCDYAANGGDRAYNQPSLVDSGWQWIGPPTFAAGDAALDPSASVSWRLLADGATGIVFCTSMVKPDQVLDGWRPELREISTGRIAAMSGRGSAPDAAGLAGDLQYQLALESLQRLGGASSSFAAGPAVGEAP